MMLDLALSFMSTLFLFVVFGGRRSMIGASDGRVYRDKPESRGDENDA